MHKVTGRRDCSGVQQWLLSDFIYTEGEASQESI